MTSIKDRFIKSEKELESKVNTLCENLIYLLNEEEFRLESKIEDGYIHYDLERPIDGLEKDEIYSSIVQSPIGNPKPIIFKITIIDKDNYYQINIDYLDEKLASDSLSAIIKDKENEKVVELINTILAKDQIEMNNIAIGAIDYINKTLF